MSNQVYSNNQNKYYKQKGVVVLDHFTTEITTSESNFYWQKNITEDNNVIYFQDGGNSGFRIYASNDAFYFFNVTFELINSTLPEVNAIEPVIIVFYNNSRVGDIAISTFLQKLMPKSIDPSGDTNRRISLCFSTYMNKNEYIYMPVQALSANNIDVVNAQCIINSI